MALITRPDAARELGVTVQSVYAAIKTGRLSAVQTDDGKILIDNRTMKKEWKSKTAKKLGNRFKEDKPTYNDMMIAQIDEAIKTKGEGDLKSLLYSGHTWEVS